MSAQDLLRRTILGLSKSEGLERLVHRYGPALGAYRFVAGDTLTQALTVIERLNHEKLTVTLDHVGESVTTKEQAIQAADSVIEMLDGIAERGVESTVSLKLTQVGLTIDQDLCLENVQRVVQRAADHKNLVTIDMEDSSVTDVTLSLHQILHQKLQNVGVVIQAYLYRSIGDLKTLAARDVHVRIVKGAYMENKEVAYPLKSDVDRNYVHLAQYYLQNGAFTAIATHDVAIIDHMKDFIKQHQIPSDRFEFQMLYGVQSRLQHELADEGYAMRVYVPFGEDWYAYYMRRLAERPANLMFFLRSLKDS